MQGWVEIRCLDFQFPSCRLKVVDWRVRKMSCNLCMYLDLLSCFLQLHIDIDMLCSSSVGMGNLVILVILSPLPDLHRSM